MDYSTILGYLKADEPFIEFSEVECQIEQIENVGQYKCIEAQLNRFMGKYSMLCRCKAYQLSPIIASKLTGVPAMEGLGDMIADVWEKFKAFISKIWENIKSAFSISSARDRHAMGSMKSKLKKCESDISIIKSNKPDFEIGDIFTTVSTLPKILPITRDLFTRKLNQLMALRNELSNARFNMNCRNIGNIDGISVYLDTRGAGHDNRFSTELQGLDDCVATPVDTVPIDTLFDNSGWEGISGISEATMAYVNQAKDHVKFVKDIAKFDIDKHLLMLSDAGGLGYTQEELNTDIASLRLMAMTYSSYERQYGVLRKWIQDVAGTMSVEAAKAAKASKKK